MRFFILILTISLAAILPACATTTTNLRDEIQNEDPSWRPGLVTREGNTLYAIGCFQLLGPAQESFAWTQAELEARQALLTYMKHGISVELESKKGYEYTDGDKADLLNARESVNRTLHGQSRGELREINVFDSKKFGTTRVCVKMMGDIVNIHNQ